MATKKKRIFQFNPTSVKWIKAVKYYINGECGGNAEKCMLKAGFAKTTSRAHNHQLKHHPDYIAWQKTQTKKNLITKEYLEQKLFDIIEENGRDRVSAISKAMEMFGFIAPKKLEHSGEIEHSHTLFREVVHIMDKVDQEKNDRNDSKNRIAKYHNK